MKIFLTIVALIQFTWIFGQFQPLKGLDFETGNYCLLATFSQSDRSSLRDSLGEWYVDDISLLKELQTLWIFDEEAPYYACGYHYSFIICKDGLQVDRFYVNLNCGTIVHDGKSYRFDNNKLRYLSGKKRGRFITERHLMDIKEARAYVASIMGNPKLIYTPTHDWMNYEGTFEFTYTYAEGTEVYFPELEEKIDGKMLVYTEDSVLSRIEAEIRKAYPGEEFLINSIGGSLTEIFVRITCNQSLYDKFTLYPIKEYYNWELFKPRFETYWK